LKYSLTSKQISNIFSSACKFRTKNISFKYLFNGDPGVAFSVGKRAGNAVLRNKFKRQARSLTFNALFPDNNIRILIHPNFALHKKMSIKDDIRLFQLHLQNRD
jgi:ribonuclease P protein component